jgi:hypothetical protein
MKGFNLACWPNGKALDYDFKVIKRLQVVSYHTQVDQVESSLTHISDPCVGHTALQLSFCPFSCVFLMTALRESGFLSAK